MLLVLKAILVFVVLGMVTSRSADDSNFMKRIIGGEVSKENQWPWLVNILVLNKTTNTYQHRCGGSLIDAEWVLTASHCLVFSFDAKYKIRLGEHDYNVDSGNELEHTIDFMHIHDRFLAESQNAYDIALLKIKPPVTFSKYVKSINLPSLYYQVPVGSHCLVAGWGRMSAASREKSTVLRHVEVPIVSYKNCTAVNNKLPYSDVDLFSNICAGDVNSDKAPCHGDSGGGLVCKNSAGQYELQGIVSWGDEHCGKETYVVFTRVSSFIDWIAYKMTSPPPKLVRDRSKDYHYYCAEWMKQPRNCDAPYIQWLCPKSCGRRYC